LWGEGGRRPDVRKFSEDGFGREEITDRKNNRFQHLTTTRRENDLSTREIILGREKNGPRARVMLGPVSSTKEGARRGRIVTVRGDSVINQTPKG